MKRRTVLQFVVASVVAPIGSSFDRHVDSYEKLERVIDLARTDNINLWVALRAIRLSDRRSKE